MLGQAASVEVTSISYQNGIEKTICRTHRYFIDFENQIDFELSGLNRCYTLHLDLPFIIDEVSMDFRREISM